MLYVFGLMLFSVFGKVQSLGCGGKPCDVWRFSRLAMRATHIVPPLSARADNLELAG